jgi:hypothetical protein
MGFFMASATMGSSSWAKSGETIAIASPSAVTRRNGFFIVEGRKKIVE